MKILMLTSGTIHSSLSHRPLNLARKLVARGHEVTILAPRYDKYSNFSFDTPKAVDGVSMAYPWQMRSRFFLLGLATYIMSSAFLSLKLRADLVYLAKPTPITITGLLAKLRRTPIVVDFDDLGSEVMQREGQPAFMYHLVSACERLAAKMANGISAASVLLQTELSQTHPRTPIARIPNGVNPEEFIATNTTRPPQIIFFGGLGRASLLQPALTALSQIAANSPNLPLQAHVLGDGPARADLEHTAHKLELDSIATFHGWTKLSDVARYAHRGDIGLCIMPEERTTAACSNQKVFQYFSLGLCVVASTVGDLPLYLDHGQAGELVPPNDPVALAATLTRLLNNPTERKLLAKAGTHHVRAHYTWSILAEQTDNLLQQVRKHNQGIQRDES